MAGWICRCGTQGYEGLAAFSDTQKETPKNMSEKKKNNPKRMIWDTRRNGKQLKW